MTAAQKMVLRLMFLPCLLATFDVALTLYYQPGDYWNGNYADASDGNPLVLRALRIHPLWMLPGTLGWLMIVWFLLFHTASWIALRVYVILLIGHTIGGCGWLLRYHAAGPWLYAAIAFTVFALGRWAVRPYWHCWSVESTLRNARFREPATGMSTPT